ncbi:MAG: hypothetical protein EAZ95_07740 [Bacteroidetes bacterium]|nr:MAG: hypothetical protein EAZ95_07740 [Bacteroidota bacterium]
MPITLSQLIPANNANVGYALAKELALQTVAQFGAVRSTGTGIAEASCCAAVAINPNPVTHFQAANPINGGAALPYSIAYGNSRIAASGLDTGNLGGHAERCALTAAAGEMLYLLPGSNHAVLFVELTPCGACQTWLNGGGGGVANPFNGIFNGAGIVTLNVWWRWAYPDDGGLAAMKTFHSWTTLTQQNDINVNW